MYIKLISAFDWLYNMPCVDELVKLLRNQILTINLRFFLFPNTECLCRQYFEQRQS